MASLLHFQSIILFLLLGYSKTSQVPSLLALNCTPQHKQTHIPDKSIISILDNLISTMNATQLLTFTVGTRPDHFNGLMQCRLGLSPTACAVCARVVKDTISTLCPNPESVTAWFNGCYIQYYNDSKFSGAVHIFSSTSNQSNIIEMGNFKVALSILLLRLRSEITAASHLGFSSGDIVYGRYNSRIHALAECVRLVSLRDCGICVGEGIKKLRECCGGSVRGVVVVAGHCMIQFEVDQLFSHSITYSSGSDSGGGTRVINYHETDQKDGFPGLRVKVVRAWGVGIVFLMGIVIGAWLLKRKIVNTAKVAVVN